MRSASTHQLACTLSPDDRSNGTQSLEATIMNKITGALAIAGLFSVCSLNALATEDKNPQTALPVDSHAQPAESNAEKANKRGEEASGSNSGADADALIKEKEAHSAEKKPAQ